MHALQSPSPNQQPVRRSRTTTHPRLRKQRHPYRMMAIETGVKLGVNVLLSTVAISALAHLFPYIGSQKGKLDEVQTAVQTTRERLQLRQTTFGKYFDPYQTRALMQEQSNRMDPQQRQIILQESANSVETASEQAAAAESPVVQLPKPNGY